MTRPGWPASTADEQLVVLTESSGGEGSRVGRGNKTTKRIYDCRHTYATMSLAAGVLLFSLSRRMGTSLDMIDRTYVHLAPDAEVAELAPQLLRRRSGYSLSSSLSTANRAASQLLYRVMRSLVEERPRPR